MALNKEHLAGCLQFLQETVVAVCHPNSTNRIQLERVNKYGHTTPHNDLQHTLLNSDNQYQHRV